MAQLTIQSNESAFALNVQLNRDMHPRVHILNFSSDFHHGPSGAFKLVRSLFFKIRINEQEGKWPLPVFNLQELVKTLETRALVHA